MSAWRFPAQTWVVKWKLFFFFWFQLKQFICGLRGELCSLGKYHVVSPWCVFTRVFHPCSPLYCVPSNQTGGGALYNSTASTARLHDIFISLSFKSDFFLQVSFNVIWGNLPVASADFIFSYLFPKSFF